MINADRRSEGSTAAPPDALSELLQIDFLQDNIAELVLRHSIDVAASPSAQEIVLALTREIVEGDLAPGSDLNSVSIATRFGTSRSPVREAFAMLQRQGLIEVPPRRRPFVKSMGLDDIHDLYRVRAELYGFAAEQLVLRASDEDILTLRRFQEARHDAVADGDSLRYHWIVVVSRMAQIALTRNKVLTELLESIAVRDMVPRKLHLDRPGELVRSSADHDRLQLAFEERDAKTAVGISQRLVFRGLRTAEELFHTRFAAN
jgi:DNA-binding GntR family transcriptional regulator